MASLLDKAKKIAIVAENVDLRLTEEHIQIAPILGAFVEMVDALTDTTNALDTAMSELAEGVSYPYGEQRRDNNQALLARIKGKSSEEKPDNG